MPFCYPNRRSHRNALYPTNTRRWTNVDLMLARSRRRWAILNQHWLSVSCLLGISWAVAHFTFISMRLSTFSSKKGQSHDNAFPSWLISIPDKPNRVQSRRMIIRICIRLLQNKTLASFVCRRFSTQTTTCLVPPTFHINIRKQLIWQQSSWI